MFLCFRFSYLLIFTTFFAHFASADEGLVANTRVLTPEGYNDVSALDIGSTVLRCTGEKCRPHEIIDIQKSVPDNLVQISFEGHTVIVGKEQLFYVGQDWIPATKLAPGMKVATRTGYVEVSAAKSLSNQDDSKEIIAISLEPGSESENEPYHEYHISDLDLVTHNSPGLLAPLVPIGLFATGIMTLVVGSYNEQLVWGTIAVVGVVKLINDVLKS